MNSLVLNFMLTFPLNKVSTATLPEYLHPLKSVLQTAKMCRSLLSTLINALIFSLIFALSTAVNSFVCGSKSAKTLKLLNSALPARRKCVAFIPGKFIILPPKAKLLLLRKILLITLNGTNFRFSNSTDTSPFTFILSVLKENFEDGTIKFFSVST